MHLRSLRLLCTFLPLGAAAFAAAATDPDPLDVRTRNYPSVSPAPSSAPRGSSAARGPLPDPILLDGSNQPQEKKPEYGMLGEFEIPGSDEKSDKVGGPQQEQPSGGGAKSDEKNAQGGGSQQSADKNAQGGGGGQQSADKNASGGGASASDANASAQSGGGGAAGDQIAQNGGTGGSVAGNDPNAKAEGVQSSGLNGAGGGSAAQSDAPPAKPGEMKVGDATMQIKTLPPGAASSVVGLQQPVGKDTPQAYDARTPGGGRQSGSSGGNKGVEKGRTMPAGM